MTNDAMPEWAKAPEGADILAQDAGRAVRMRLAGNRPSGAPKATLASAANAIRAMFGGAR
jgi:hypothetical protein